MYSPIFGLKCARKQSVAAYESCHAYLESQIVEREWKILIYIFHLTDDFLELWSYMMYMVTLKYQVPRDYLLA